MAKIRSHTVAGVQIDEYEKSLVIGAGDPDLQQGAGGSRKDRQGHHETTPGEAAGAGGLR
jgi:hypothetical protein